MEVARQFWINLGYDCIEPDEYGVDLLVEGKGRKFGCEVEVKTDNFFCLLNNARSHAVLSVEMML